MYDVAGWNSKIESVKDSLKYIVQVTLQLKEGSPLHPGEAPQNDFKLMDRFIWEPSTANDGFKTIEWQLDPLYEYAFTYYSEIIDRDVSVQGVKKAGLMGSMAMISPRKRPLVKLLARAGAQPLNLETTPYGAAKNDNRYQASEYAPNGERFLRSEWPESNQPIALSFVSKSGPSLPKYSRIFVQVFQRRIAYKRTSSGSQYSPIIAGPPTLQRWNTGSSFGSGNLQLDRQPSGPSS
ncbi:MAG: hypothetical protein M1825_001005 [Sarcosagium campestre]|nr:MAG: hypothetical protein M1825_001005 [Sarcosagium campestre]